MDLSRRRFLGVSSTAALAAGTMLAGTASPAAAAPTPTQTFTPAETAAIGRLAELVSAFPVPLPGREAKAAGRVTGADLSRLTKDFSITRQRRIRTAARRLAPYTAASDERLLAVLARLEPAGLVPVVAVAGHLVTGRSDPWRNDAATVWLSAVRRHVGEEAGR